MYDDIRIIYVRVCVCVCLRATVAKDGEEEEKEEGGAGARRVLAEAGVGKRERKRKGTDSRKKRERERESLCGLCWRPAERRKKKARHYRGAYNRRDFPILSHASCYLLSRFLVFRFSFISSGFYYACDCG